MDHYMYMIDIAACQLFQFFFSLLISFQWGNGDDVVSRISNVLKMVETCFRKKERSGRYTFVCYYMYAKAQDGNQSP